MIILYVTGVIILGQIKPRSVSYELEKANSPREQVATTAPKPGEWWWFQLFGAGEEGSRDPSVEWRTRVRSGTVVER
jgi:hypothetical protein